MPRYNADPWLKTARVILDKLETESAGLGEEELDEIRQTWIEQESFNLEYAIETQDTKLALSSLADFETLAFDLFEFEPFEMLPLSLASRHGNREVCKRLLELGADGQ